MDSSGTIFIQLAVVLGLSAALGYVMRTLRLPLLVAYLIAGVLLSLLKLFDVTNSAALTFLPEIGIAFVLFLVGMELDIKEIKHLGKPIFVAGLVQILLSILAGIIIATFLGFPQTESFYLGVGLSFSSTIVVVKLLLEKKDLGSLHGRLSLGILLLEDLVAILLLMMMTVNSSILNLGLQSSVPILTLFAKGFVILISALILSKYVLDRVFNAVAKSPELLFLSSVAWCFIFVAFSLLMGFSVVIGAFLAGVALANSRFHFEIQGKVKPLRDFFVTLFFVYLGSQVSFNHLLEILPLIIIFTLYALAVKPLIFLLILGAFGFRKHTIFQTALNLSQISEFSLIIMVIGLKMGVVSEAALTAMALTGVISIIISSIMITFSRQIYDLISPAVKFFEHTSLVHQTENRRIDPDITDHVILIGAEQMGSEIIKFLKREKIPFLVLDFNPKVVTRLAEEKINVLYGDVGDPEILEFLNLEKSKLIISTADEMEDVLILLSEMKRRRIQSTTIIRAESTEDAETFYKAGADYVVLPDIMSGDVLVQLLKNHWPSMQYFKARSEIELNKLTGKTLLTR